MVETNTLNKFNKADKVLAFVFVLFLIFLSLKLIFRGNIVFEFLLFVSEAALVGGVADWFAVKALFAKPLGFPWHTAILPRRRAVFINSCIKMLQTEFLSKRKIYKRICNADLLARGLNWLREPANKTYLVHVIMRFLVGKLQHVDSREVAKKYHLQFEQIVLKEPMQSLSNRFIDMLNTDGNNAMTTTKCINLLKAYFAGEQGRRRVLNFVEAYQRQYEKNGLSGLMLSFALATNALDPEELADVMYKRINELLNDATPDSEVYAGLTEFFNNLLVGIRDDEDWADSMVNLREGFVKSGAVERILSNIIKNVCDYLVVNSGEGNKMHLAVEHIFTVEIDNCIEKLNTNNEFKGKINRFVLDVLHRSALKGEDMILELARNFLEGLTDKQLNELVYSKVETDMIWIRLNGSIVGSIIGVIAFLILQIAK